MLKSGGRQKSEGSLRDMGGIGPRGREIAIVPVRKKMMVKRRDKKRSS